MTSARTARRGGHKYIDPWPSFLPLVTTAKEREQADRFARAAASFVARRFKDDDTARLEVLAMLFAPPRDVTDMYGRTR